MSSELPASSRDEQLLQELEKLKRANEEERRRHEEERLRYEEEKRRLEEEGRRHEEERLRYEEEKHHLDEERRRHEEERLRYEEEKRRLEEEGRRHEEERLRYEEDRRQRSEDRKKQQEELEALKQQVKPTTLPEYLDACHVYLSVGFESRVDHKDGTKGPVENAKSKLRPRYIREWRTFPQEQAKVWELLFESDFVSQPHFASANGVEQEGKYISLRMLRSELDLGYYERYTVEDRVAFIIQTLYADPKLRKTFNLMGSVTFENHGNTITPGSDEEVNAGLPLPPPQSPVQKRRKQTDSADPLTVHTGSSRPRADQFCVYNSGNDKMVPAFIIEYKPPHKLLTDSALDGLLDIEVDEVVISSDNDDEAKRNRRMVAAVITQTFSYMIQARIEFGYVCSGELFIFLRIDPNDPTTVYYYRSTPNEDVGETTGWTGDSDGGTSDSDSSTSDSGGHNRLHLTAIGQVLAFTLRALRSPPHGQNWPTDTEERLKKWEIEFNHDVVYGLDSSSPPEKLPSSGYKPPRSSRDEYMRMSPVKTRSKRRAAAAASSCREPEEPNPESSDGDDESGNWGTDPNSPTPRRPRPLSKAQVVVSSRSRPPPPPPTERKRYVYNTGPINPWCTQKCLAGLRTRGLLDPKCPNVAIHGTGPRHAIDDFQFRKLMREQIVGPKGPWGCESMHRHGTSGALFWVTTFPYGYTLVAKAMPIETVRRAIHEENIYQQLYKIQGKYVPVCLGSIDVSGGPLWYDGIFPVVHLLFLSHVGKSIVSHAQGRNRVSQFIPSAREALQAIHRQLTLHCDTHVGNMFWSRENKRVMFIDFERARIAKEKKRKRGAVSPQTRVLGTEFERELRSATSEMA
ncbi:hypothetical protein H112_02848 [Trichophyton rubrum D6]|uniref:Protein kinase domain-containing protein n=3 Tax=Trichophyton rubrum TaxID=5551 RepID=A0A178EYD3_TRIRU|nr:uncharacterized protein TERG_05480 [Trichophyton rubrum CBS 118892]EZF24749.1 hypothetical protein H100_02853 [Trichophyton rubrum MR850]EZF43710.1 hypothetical protein H102_02846 [Trichophyton rubrum CBS 100081]EZF54410.1 hypothetical protein H103_02859 [Trichophyton rubrum CBS 288.86]EZF64964.1 hypothetical protein H104_02838 [Trichophyton rubrum CBS 289.86]EZF86309.1 hypothetical protein H110_02858 [Trichophyton rubrum MR1448]EZF97038.1 hypothetical protein H113_02860 [Trichophyton rubr